ncbi:MAG: hypothetical protein K5853_04245 [Lachnospiraceae bacterium]|nr:hypothetical protein [Lachnospiraceae bacterium]
MDYHMPQIQGIDWEKAHRYIPSKDLLLDVLKEIIKQAPKDTKLLRDYKEQVTQDPSEENYTAYRIQAHAMKASLRSIGSDLFDEAYALEIAGRQMQMDPILKDTEAFIRDYLSLAEILKGLVDTDADDLGFDEALFFEKIKCVKTAMEAFDVPTLQEAFHIVSDMEIPVQYADHINALKPAVRDLDYDTVMKLCDEIEEMRN